MYFWDVDSSKNNSGVRRSGDWYEVVENVSLAHTFVFSQVERTSPKYHKIKSIAIKFTLKNQVY